MFSEDDVTTLAADLQARLGTNPVGQWSTELAKVALTFKTPEAALDLALDLAGIMDRESLGGEALKPKGCAGTGDFALRHGHLPPDGQGWGRGLMQLDYAAHPELMTKTMPDGTPAWQDAFENIKAGATIYLAALTYFHGDKTKALPSYNCGIGNTKRALSEGKSPDALTTGGNYGADVLKRRARWV